MHRFRGGVGADLHSPAVARSGVAAVHAAETVAELLAPLSCGAAATSARYGLVVVVILGVVACGGGSGGSGGRAAASAAVGGRGVVAVVGAVVGAVAGRIWKNEQVSHIT